MDTRNLKYGNRIGWYIVKMVDKKIIKEKLHTHDLKTAQRRRDKFFAERGLYIITRGRPNGHRLDSKSKKKISSSKTGQHHSEGTKRAISNGVKRIGKPSVSLERVMSVDLDTATKSVTKRGYVTIYVPPLKDGEVGTRMFEHNIVMEQYLGRKLRPEEEVHHCAEKFNNHIGALVLCKNRKEHVRLDKIKKQKDACYAEIRARGNKIGKELFMTWKEKEQRK